MAAKKASSWGAHLCGGRNTNRKKGRIGKTVRHKRPKNLPVAKHAARATIVKAFIGGKGGGRQMKGGLACVFVWRGGALATPARAPLCVARKQFRATSVRSPRISLLLRLGAHSSVHVPRPMARRGGERQKHKGAPAVRALWPMRASRCPSRHRAAQTLLTPLPRTRHTISQRTRRRVGETGAGVSLSLERKLGCAGAAPFFGCCSCPPSTLKTHRLSPLSSSTLLQLRRPVMLSKRYF